MTTAARRVGTRLITGALRKKYRSIEWIGELPQLPKDIPLVVYTNHHVYDDGYIMCHLIERVLKRPMYLWMEQLDRFPFFKTMGAMPFPKDDATRRITTIRATARQLERSTDSVLIYFPEGNLHSGCEGVSNFPTDVFARLDRVLPQKLWWPISIRVSGWHKARPKVLLNGGGLHAASHGREQATLDSLLEESRSVPDTHQRTTILSGRKGPNERWDFSFFGKKRA